MQWHQVSNPKKTLENILLRQRYNGIRPLFIFMAWFSQEVVLRVFTMLYSGSPQTSFKMRDHMTIFWNLAQRVIFRVHQSRKVGDTEEFLLFWNGCPSFFGRVLGPLSEKPRMISRYEFFYGTLLQSLPYIPFLTFN